MKVKMICISCPRGCHLTVDSEPPHEVEGNKCPRGVLYAHNELLHPVRTVTSTVHVEGSRWACCPVKTQNPIPKGTVFAAMQVLKQVSLKAPIACGSVVVEDICGTGVHVISTKEIGGGPA